MITFEKVSTVSIEGETCSGIPSYGTGVEYWVFDQANSIKALLRYETWETAERNINCLDAQGHTLLSTIVGRMRLVIEHFDDRLDFFTFKTAILRSEFPPYANLYNKSPDYYLETLGISLKDYFSNIQGMRFGTKEELLNRSGRERNEYCMLFPRGNHIIPLMGFMTSRVLPIILPLKK